MADYGVFRDKWKLKRWLKNGKNGSVGGRGELKKRKVNSPSMLADCSPFLLVYNFDPISIVIFFKRTHLINIQFKI